MKKIQFELINESIWKEFGVVAVERFGVYGAIKKGLNEAIEEWIDKHKEETIDIHKEEGETYNAYLKKMEELSKDKGIKYDELVDRFDKAIKEFKNDEMLKDPSILYKYCYEIIKGRIK